VHSYSLALPGLDFQEAAASLSSEVQVFFFELENNMETRTGLGQGGDLQCIRDVPRMPRRSHGRWYTMSTLEQFL
jgi:hypothetical protein